MQKRALLISLNFPPSNIASVHRCRHLANHLGHFGWSTTTIAVHEDFHKEVADPFLELLVKQDVDLVKIPALPVSITKWLGVGDLSLRAHFHLREAMKKILSKENFDVVLITGWPYYQMLNGYWIKEIFKVPVILDFQDPWVSAEGATLSKLSKGGISHLLATILEPIALRSASFVVSVSELQNQQMADRYSWLNGQDMAAIPIGGDPNDFEVLRSNPPPCPQVQLNGDYINLCYVGTFLPRASSLMRTLFASLSDLREQQPALASKLRLTFVGTSNQTDGRSEHLITPIATEAGVADLVFEHPARVPFLEALSLLANSDGLLMIGSNEPHYTASKIYPGLMSGTPFLSLFHSASSAHKVLSTAGGGLAFGFETNEELIALRPSLTRGFARLIASPKSINKADPIVYEKFSALGVAGQFASVFEKVADRSRLIAAR